MTLNPTDGTTGPFQYIPVPNEHVPAVLAYLGDLLTAPAASAPPTTKSPVAPALKPKGDAATDGWTDEELARFFTQGTKTSQNVERMLRHLAVHPGEDAALSTRELAEALSMKYSEMKILPTQVARTLSKHFHGMTAPWSYKTGPNFTPPRSNEVYFWTTAERAAQLSRLDDLHAS